MKFENLEKTWESFGKNDPLWAILTWEEKKNNNWNSKEFFETGISEINFIISEAEKRKKIKPKERVLDFGCGVGRLTFPLGSFFQESHGVDISKEMILKAEAYKKEKNNTNVIFHINKTNNLSLFRDSFFDFIVSIIVLQHMDPEYALNYINEFVRILKPRGLCVFQLPDKIEFRANYENFSENIEPVMEMYGISKDDLTKFIKQKGGKIIDIVEDQSCGPEIKSFRYFITKSTNIR